MENTNEFFLKLKEQMEAVTQYMGIIELTTEGIF